LKEKKINVIYKFITVCAFFYLFLFLLSFCIVKFWWDKCYAVFSNVIHGDLFLLSL